MSKDISAKKMDKVQQEATTRDIEIETMVDWGEAETFQQASLILDKEEKIAHKLNRPSEYLATFYEGVKRAPVALALGVVSLPATGIMIDTSVKQFMHQNLLENYGVLSSGDVVSLGFVSAGITAGLIGISAGAFAHVYNKGYKSREQNQKL